MHVCVYGYRRDYCLGLNNYKKLKKLFKALIKFVLQKAASTFGVDFVTMRKAANSMVSNQFMIQSLEHFVAFSCELLFCELCAVCEFFYP